MATTARNQQDVDNMNVRDRLWDSLSYSYGKKREDSDKSFAKAYSQAVNQGIKTGMQRSSYAAQTLANIDKQKIDAQNDIYDQQIADYENRLYQIERDEKADEQWEKEYQRALDQFNQNMEFQRERANVSDAQWKEEYAEKKRQFDEQMAEQKRQFDLEYGLKSSAYSGGYGGGGGGGSYTPTTNNDNNDGKGLTWIEEASMVSKNASNNYLSTAKSAANVLKDAFDTINVLQQPHTNAVKAQEQAAQDKKNTVQYQVNNKKQSASKNVTIAKK